MVFQSMQLVNLKDQIYALHESELAIDEKIQKLSNMLVSLNDEESQAFQKLAEFRLDQLTAQKYITDLTKSERKAINLVATLNKELQDLVDDRRKLLFALKDSNAEFETVTSDLEAADSSLASFVEDLKPSVYASNEWKEQYQRVELAGQKLGAAQEKANRAIEDRELKRKPYEDDMIFMYLFKRHYATSQYASGFFVKYFDDKCAALISYRRQLPSYRLLLEIPQRLQEHCKSLEAQLAEEQDKLIDIEESALVSNGVETHREALKAVQLRFDTVRSDIEAIEARIAEIDTEVAELTNPEKNESLEAALSLLQRELERSSIHELYHQARETRSADDDEIVSHIERILRDRGQIKQELGDYRNELNNIAHDRRELEIERDRLERKMYRGNRRRGWHRTNGNSNWGGTWGSGSWGGGSSGGGSWGSRSGGGFGGGGFSTGGGFGGGGGSSGGGF